MVNETPLSVYADCAASLSSLRDSGPVIFQGQHWRQLNPVDTRKPWLSPEIPLDSPLVELSSLVSPKENSFPPYFYLLSYLF